MQTAELEALNEEITVLGNQIRDLKSQKADSNLVSLINMIIGGIWLVFSEMFLAVALRCSHATPPVRKTVVYAQRSGRQVRNLLIYVNVINYV